jgi:2-polyprenyl-3-methyl-5-hydroxy-6-metoxy-1,4-benzoquinol methylase
MNNILKYIRYKIYKAVGADFYEKMRYIYYKNFVPESGYDKNYYYLNYQANNAIYSLLAKTLFNEFKPLSVVDAGCGNGGISLALLEAGCKQISAFDASTASVKFAKSMGLEHVQKLDFTSAEKIPALGDLCICCEVAEHIPEKYANHLCDLLSKVAPILVFTAAPPGQGGHLHVNLKPQDWWITMMQRHGLVYDAELVSKIRSAYQGKMISDYDSNMMIFKRL